MSQFFYAASSIALKGYSSTVQNTVAVFRNLAAMKNVKSKALELVLILAGVVLGFVFNNRGLLGWLPILANLEYSVAVFRFRDNERALKLAFIVNMIISPGRDSSSKESQPGFSYRTHLASHCFSPIE